MCATATSACCCGRSSTRFTLRGDCYERHVLDVYSTAREENFVTELLLPVQEDTEGFERLERGSGSPERISGKQESLTLCQTFLFFPGFMDWMGKKFPVENGKKNKIVQDFRRKIPDKVL